MAAWADGLGNHGVDLAGHDRGTGLAGRQADLAQARVGTRREQPQIVGALQQAGGQGLEDAADLDEDVGVLRGLDEVLRPGQPQAGDLPQVLDDAEDILAAGRLAGADGRAAQVHHAQPLFALVDPPAIAVEKASA
jgi:hypothetical protein